MTGKPKDRLTGAQDSETEPGHHASLSHPSQAAPSNPSTPPPPITLDSATSATPSQHLHPDHTAQSSHHDSTSYALTSNQHAAAVQSPATGSAAPENPRSPSTRIASEARPTTNQSPDSSADPPPTSEPVATDGSAGVHPAPTEPHARVPTRPRRRAAAPTQAPANWDELSRYLINARSAIRGVRRATMASHGSNGVNAPHHASPTQQQQSSHPAAPRASSRLSTSSDQNPPAREKTSGSFYDPLTDTTRERRPSDSWSSSRPSRLNEHPYSSTQNQRNGHESPSSPVKRESAPRSRSPLSHSHPKSSNGYSADPASPTNKALNLKSSPSRSRPAPEIPAREVSSKPAVSSMSSILNPEPAAAPASAPAASSTPSRAAELMSFSNILSSAEPLPKPNRPVIMTEEKKKPARKSKGRESHLRNTETKKVSRRSSSGPNDVASRGAKRQSNGTVKPKQLSAEKEKKIEKFMEQLEAQADDVDLSELEIEKELHDDRSKRRKVDLEQIEANDNKLRRGEFSIYTSKKLSSQAVFGKRRYDDLHYEEAMSEVREREVHAEKERKKDMQRKRRREKSMQVTIEQKEAALARALAAEDESERQKHLREAERASKKAQQTKLILQKGIKGPARNIASSDINLEGGTQSVFLLGSDAEPSTKSKSKRNGTRPKKSKEQKQAEKDAAEAAQAAIDAGEELPPAREEQKIRIKLSKSSSNLKEARDKDRDSEDTREAKEKVVEEPVNPLETKFQSKGYNQIYDQIWRDLARKDVSRTYKLAVDSYATKASNLKKTAILASKEAKRWQLRTNKGTKDLQARAKRCMRDMMSFWKRNEREERDLRKAAERQEIENARKEEAEREAARQKRKLNFLISQTELYSHFIGKKIKTDEVERSTDNPEIAPAAENDSVEKKDVAEPTGPVGAKVTNFDNLTFEEEDEEKLQAAAVANAQNAIAEAQQKARAFNKKDTDMDEDGEMNFQNPTGMGDVEIEQPKMLNCQLKEYQIKGLNWLANLYEQGINGILADEMGLGKTVQSISVMAYLAEVHDIWGPFLVVAPASTLHNWQQEIARFVPDLKCLPYWGTAGDRKILRKFWDRKHNTYRKDSPFHVLVTSYQMVVSDVAYFQKMRWQYMILDEAQAIKSSQSSRWKCLLSFHCRNRLLLTGTPIQNNMQELWALLHFIMPSLFDSHDEFSEWFSKDIESHAQSNTTLNEDQLKRLHMILKPFMLRRVKKHVQKELGDKIELDVYCDLTYRQRAYYRNLRNQISFMDLIEKATLGDDQDSGTLMNLVMQFRKVCNHPDLFERADTTSPLFSGYFAETASFLREGTNIPVGYSTRSLIEYKLPRLVGTDGGRLYKAGKDNEKAGFRNKYLNHLMNIWTPDNIRDSTSGRDAFSFLRFADTSAQEAHKASQRDVYARAVDMVKKERRLGHMNVIYDESEDQNFTPAHALFQIRARADRQPLADMTKEGILGKLMNITKTDRQFSGLSRLEQAALPGATAAPIQISCDGTRAPMMECEDTLFNVPMRKALYGPNPLEEKALVTQNYPLERYPTAKMLPPPDNEKRRFTNITVPSMRRFVTDSGKLAKLDALLFKLKEEGHRVLLYFQMTRMIDLMEEYLTYRNYKYCRLDGSTKLEDRRDTVTDFQTRPEIFIFLLSTRAGGLGINLTSADTVIFYDSDWNPTIDSQAMDRAHRLGQTRQVTVYRLITRGTIEERIRKRAMQKEEVQRVVISGGGARGVDFSGRRPAENRNKDIALWLADDEQAEMIERREKELRESGELEKQTKKRGGGKRKREAVSLDDMYHEGEGHFDDGNKPSGTATPAEADAPAAPAAKKRRAGGKKAKTAKQRLAIADGEIDM